MAGYGYMNRGYTCYTDDRNKKTYGESGYFDPASRPTIFEAEGRKRPIVSYSPNPGSESYITTSTDRTLEYGRPPMEPVKDYGYTDDKWRRSSNPIRNCPQRVEEFISNVQVEPNQGATRPGFLGTTNWRNQAYSGNGTGYGEYDNYHRNDNFTEPAMIQQDRILKYVVGVREEYKLKTSPVIVATAVAQPWSSTAPVSTVPSRYGKFNLSSRPY